MLRRCAAVFAVLMLLAVPHAVQAQGAAAGAGSAVALPAVIPLFPLPEVALFPDVPRPLLIFEARYREMVADALRGDRIIGMVLLRPGFEKDYEGRPPIFEIGCAGAIEQYELLPDGRYTILLRGLTKFRVVSEDQRRPYRQARVEVMPESPAAADLAPLSELRERLLARLVAALPADAELPPASLSDVEYINLIAQYLDMPESTRQELLELSSVLLRGRRLVELLEGR